METRNPIPQIPQFFQQPWVVIIGLGGALAAIFLMMLIPETEQKPAFIASVIISTTLVTKAAVSMKSDAPASATALFFFGAAVLLNVVHFLGFTSFKDMAFEAAVSAFGSAFAALLDEAIHRSNRLRGVSLEE